MTKFAFATVVFEPEVALLELQARAMARRVSPGAVSKVVVIDNTADGLSRRASRRLLRRYGHLAGIVEIVRAEDLHVDGGLGADGWSTQQILKLAVAGRVDAPWYVALDAKNVPVRPVTPDVFLSADGRAKMGRHTYRGHPLEKRVSNTLAQVGVSADNLDSFPVTHTPFVFRTDAVLELMTGLAAAANKPFSDAFLGGGFLEFPLYSATLIRDGRLDGLYSAEVIQTPALWRRGVGGDGVTNFTERLAEDDVAFIALHRAALARLKPRQAAKLVDALTRKGVFDSRRSGWWFLGTFTVRFALAKVSMKMRGNLGQLRPSAQRGV